MLNIILQSLRFYWRTHLGVLAGTLLASAVLTGALLVGDSVDYSLRTFATMRLGGIHHAVSMQNQFFEQTLVSELSKKVDTDLAAALQLRGMAIVQGEGSEDRRQVNRVEIVGVDSDFWAFGEGPAINLGPNETAINAKLAIALGVEAGDEISLRVAKPSLMSRDAALSWSSEDRTRRGRYRIVKVVSDWQMGRFSLSPSQIPPYNAFIGLGPLQEQVELSGRVNLLLAGGGISTEELDLALKESWSPEHIGLKLSAHLSGVLQLDTDRVFLDPETTRAALTIPDAVGTLTYLINSISKGERSTPYSFVVAGPVPEGMRDDEIVINRWLADQLDARVGDRLATTYYELLSSNDFVERDREFTVHSIVEMADLESERDLMPNYPGLSDVESCADWTSACRWTRSCWRTRRTRPIGTPTGRRRRPW